MNGWYLAQVYLEQLLACFWMQRVPLHVENSISTSSACFIFFVTMLLTDINLALCNHLYGVGMHNSYISCVHEIICKSRAPFYVHLIFLCMSVWRFSTLCSFLPSFNTGCKLWCEFKAKLLNYNLRCHLQPLSEMWLSGRAAHSPPSQESEALWIGSQYWACGTTSHCLTFCLSFSLFSVASGKNN